MCSGDARFLGLCSVVAREAGAMNLGIRCAQIAARSGSFWHAHVMRSLRAVSSASSGSVLAL